MFWDKLSTNYNISSTEGVTLNFRLETRMHSSRMRTTCSLTVSHHILCTPPSNHACPLQPCMPPPQPHMPPSNHAHPPPTMHVPPPTTHAPHNHACPPQPCMPPSNHACPPANHTHPPCNHAYPLAPCGQTDTCKKITFVNFNCGR